MTMLLSEICPLLLCNVYSGKEQMTDIHVHFGCASDLMSDVLAFSRAGAILMTGLANLQTIQTAFIAEISAVVLVRGKRPSKDMIDMAKEKRIPLLGTPYSMYEACGILYRKGLVSTMEPAVSRATHANK